jgi:thymidylate synthase (FAD)
MLVRYWVAALKESGGSIPHAVHTAHTFRLERRTMKIIRQSHEILNIWGGTESIEKAGRTCYQSEPKDACALGPKEPCIRGYAKQGYKDCIFDECQHHSCQKFVKMLRDKGHHAMIEFGDITVKFRTNRGVTHELVRHRHCSFAQESTRYVKYDGTMEFIKPVWTNILTGTWGMAALAGYRDGRPTTPEAVWIASMLKAEEDYKDLLSKGWKAQQARELLPNSLKTEIVCKANFREWRHILNLRCAKAAHPQMRALMLPLLAELKTKIPVVFDDLVFN